MLGQLIDDLLNRLRRKAPHRGTLTSRDMDRIKSALALERNGRIEDAERIYRDLLVARPENGDVLHLAGNAARLRGNFAEAIDLLQRAAAIEPGAEVHCHLADAFAVRGDTECAIKHYERALAWEQKHIARLLRSK